MPEYANLLVTYMKITLIPDWPSRLGSNFAYVTAGLGAPKMQLAHLIQSHQWEMPNCTGFSGFAWGLEAFKQKSHKSDLASRRL